MTPISPRAVPAPARPAPVIVFAYARADHLRRMVMSLLANPEAASTDVTFYCDAPKREAHRPQVDAVRAYVDSLEGFRSIRRIYREQNMGLARSVVAGVTETLAAHGRVIVLEDDLLLSPHFLRYMNDGLSAYEADTRVASIHGYCYPCDEALPETFFLKGADCWGWATWSRAWAHYEADGAALMARLRAGRMLRDFDFDGQYPYSGMLDDQIQGRNSSWAILWYASCYLKGLLTLYPGRSLVENIGNDASGTHASHSVTFSREPTDTPVPVGAIPVEPSEVGRRAFVRFFRGGRSWSQHLRSAVRRVLKGVA